MAYAPTAPAPRVEGRARPIRCHPSRRAERPFVEHWAEGKERSARVWWDAGIEISYFPGIVAFQSRAAVGDGRGNCRDDQNLRADGCTHSAGVGRAAGRTLAQAR